MVLDTLLYARQTHNIQVGTDSRYSKNAGAVFSLKYHIVWCPKYRKKVLVGDVEIRLKNVLYATAAQYGVLIEAMEVLPDHVHLFVSSDPTRCVAEIVNRLKGASSRILREEFPHLKSRLPTLWSRSYYAGTVGHVSEAPLSSTSRIKKDGNAKDVQIQAVPNSNSARVAAGAIV